MKTGNNKEKMGHGKEITGPASEEHWVKKKKNEGTETRQRQRKKTGYSKVQAEVFRRWAISLLVMDGTLREK